MDSVWLKIDCVSRPIQWVSAGQEVTKCFWHRIFRGQQCNLLVILPTCDQKVKDSASISIQPSDFKKTKQQQPKKNLEQANTVNHQTNCCWMSSNNDIFYIFDYAGGRHLREYAILKCLVTRRQQNWIMSCTFLVESTHRGKPALALKYVNATSG